MQLKIIEFKNKNDYSVVYFFTNRSPIKWVYVDNIFKASQDILKLHGVYTHFNVYARRSARFLKQYKYNDYVDQKLH